LGFGSFVIAPIGAMLVNPKDPVTVLYALKIFGVAFLVIISLASIILVNPPEGYKPKRFNPQGSVAKAAVKIDLVWTQMLARGKFWVLYLIYACGAFSGLMIISQASPIAQSMTKDIMALKEIDPKAMAAAAGAIVALLGLSNAAGRILWGFISDKIGRLQSLALMFLITGVTMFLLPKLVTESSTLKISAILIGACFGGYLGIFPPLCADSFGVKNMAVNYGLLFSAFSVAAIAGPFVGAYISKSTGSYDHAFVIASVVALLGFVLSISLAISERKSATKPA
jgi:MFS transporter, OFA family, oxalate/formate antiporter